VCFTQGGTKFRARLAQNPCLHRKAALSTALYEGEHSGKSQALLGNQTVRRFLQAGMYYMGVQIEVLLAYKRHNVRG